MKKKLLLADDSVTIQKVVQITFSHDDYELTVVDNGDIAYENARSQRPDLILADVFMPGKNGYELCAAVKNDPSLAAVPVLLLTGTFEPFDEAKAKSVGADRWIAKPFESQALIACVEELLASSAQTPGIVPSISLPTPLAAPAPVETIELSPPVLPADSSEDIWGSDFSAESTFDGDNRPGDDSLVAAPNQNDLWDVSGFETELPVANAADSDDLWGSFETASFAPEAIAPTAAAVEVDSWESVDFSSSFTDNADAIVDSAPLSAGTAEIPIADDVEILEEIDSLEPIADFPPEISLANPVAADDFSFTEEVPQADADDTPSNIFVAPVSPPPFVPLPLPVVDVEPRAVEVALPAGGPTNAAPLSDAQLELIVERVAGVVISRLSGTLLEKIAWEVVPDLAETMIKEELRKIRESVAAE